MTLFQWFALTSPVVVFAIMMLVGVIETKLDTERLRREEASSSDPAHRFFESSVFASRTAIPRSRAVGASASGSSSSVPLPKKPEEEKKIYRFGLMAAIAAAAAAILTVIKVFS